MARAARICRDMATARNARLLLSTVVAVALALAAAAALRFAVVEPAGIAHLCGAAYAPWWCAPRALLVWVLALGAPGLGASAAGVLATFARSPAWALVAAGLGAAGLLLYSVATGAVGFLLGLLVVARAVAIRRHPHAPSERET